MPRKLPLLRPLGHPIKRKEKLLKQLGLVTQLFILVLIPSYHEVHKYI